ncbi:MAG: hypothetical protein HZB61_12015 [Nitrospirae bacterium]|nr:hypothetical protein [Nitrospirota bacterium]
MKTKTVHVLMLILCALFSGVFIACGGGGGGGSSNEGDNSKHINIVTYSGSVTQAAITANNAEEVSMMAFEGGDIAFGDMNIAQKSAAGSQTETRKTIEPARPRLLILSKTLERSFQNANIVSKSNATVSGAMESESETIEGNCGGSLDRILNYDPQTGETNGSIKYNSYCSDGVTVSGNTDMTGKYDIYTGKYLLMTINFNDLNVSYEGDTSVSRGSITYDYTAYPYAITMNMMISCSCSAKVYKYEDFRMTFSDTWDTSGSCTEFTMSGRYYDPAYGYVDVSTVRPFRIYAGANWPFTGLLVVSGSGNSRAKLEMVSGAAYRVYADEDGDGSFELDSREHWPGENSAPVANAGYGQNVYEGSEVTLDGHGSYDPDGDMMTYTWTLDSVPPGSNAALSDPNSINPKFTPDLPGRYKISLIVSDSIANSTAVEVVIYVNALPAPFANAGADQTVFQGNLVSLDGSASRSDCFFCEDSLTYNWTFVSVPAESTAVLSNPNSVGPSFIPDVIGSYVLSLVVNNGKRDSIPDTIIINAFSKLNGGSIQDAINAAESGDTIMVPPGVYYSGINFGGKDITLQSMSGSSNTIIDGDAVLAPYYTPIVIGPGGTIKGFTITNAKQAITIFGKNTRILENIFKGNSSSYLGAAITGSSASPIIEKNIFRNNSCWSDYSRKDFAVISFIDRSSPRVINNLFHENACPAIKMSLFTDEKTEVINNTFVSNSAGILESSYAATYHVYRNNIIVGNNIGFENNLTWPETGLPVWENNLVYSNTINYQGIADQTGVNFNISADPMFIDVSSGNYRLKANSPAIDSGSDLSAPTDDFDGKTRPIDGNKDGVSRTDIGAFETQ